MSEDQRRAIVAVVLSGLVLFGWQYFMGPTVEQTQSLDVVESSKVVNVNEKVIKENSDNTVSQKQSSNNNVEIVNFVISNKVASYTIDNYLNISQASSTKTNKKFTDIFSVNNAKILIESNNILSQKVFNIEKISESQLRLSNQELSINGIVSIDKKGFLVLKINSDKSFRYTIRLSEKSRSLDSGQQTQFALFDKELELFPVGDENTGDKKLNWVGLDFNYHLFAVVLKDTNYLYKAKEVGTLDLRTSESTNTLELKYIFTKKEYDHLMSLGNKLEFAVDFGMWSLIAVPILRGLQFFFSVFPNYGISIILLTLIIRMLTFPLQYKSFKSMKKMQDIQPDLNKVREKFKDNPQKMQQETMALFKRAGANPLSGCLPLLLQMPIFFAFYKVLYSAVELVDAPFYLWIVDLSEKDPYYVLPILMAGAMMLQQKLTPSTSADPMQKKLMTFMPLMFAVFMKDLPAGLTLYIFVSTMVGMAQQLLVFKRA